MTRACSHGEAARLLARGFKLCQLHSMSKRPVGDDWPDNPVERIDPEAGGYGLMLAANGMCSIDPDNVELAREGLRRCGFDLEVLMNAGVRTTSTRPGSGGRSTFHLPDGQRLKWIRFADRTNGVWLELRATSKLQDALPGTVYLVNGEGPYCQDYFGQRRLDDAPDLPGDIRAWWARMSEDIVYLHEQQRLFCGAHVELSVSDGESLAFASDLRTEFNAAHSVADILVQHGYCRDKHSGRWSPPRASGSAGVRQIPGASGLWRSDHASDPLHGTFDAWIAFVVLLHRGDLRAAERDWNARRQGYLTAGLSHVPESGGEVPLPAFERNRDGDILARKNNIVLALARSDLTGFDLRFDTFLSELMIAAAGTEGWRSFTDDDYFELSLRLENLRFKNISTELMRDAVSYFASKNEFDSAQVWLEGLQWDGVPRVESFVSVFLGGENSAYTRAVALYLFTALAGRVLSPGVKCDMVPVLVGEQGCGKSSAVGALAPANEFYFKVDLNRKEDDQARLMRGKLVGELDELRGLGTRDAEHIKSFITSRHEAWIPKFKEHEARYERRCVFIGTTNRDDFLADDTGNRRWLPLRVHKCDSVGIIKNRDQLWAEARDLYRANGILHEDAERLAVAVHADFEAHDEWASLIDAWLDQCPHFETTTRRQRGYVTASEVLKEALEIPLRGHYAKVYSRVKAAMATIGWEQKNTKLPGCTAKGRIYVPRDAGKR